jgi:crotonobetainyl-CoA:carnitine CoA-transferase CaiB-like acyl-CoA transferase
MKAIVSSEEELELGKMPRTREEVEAELDKLTFEEYCRTIFEPQAIWSKPEALRGYRVLSPTQYILGPSSCAYLAELGAETIKIEMPRLGEPMRRTTPYNEPYFFPLSRWVPDRGLGLGVASANVNKYFISLDMRKPEAKEIMHSLMRKSDMMLWNYRPGTFARWGFGYDVAQEVNPRLIQVWLGGFGGYGHARRRASYDILAQAQGGCFSITGLPKELGGIPIKHTIWLADFWGGQYGATGCLAALYWRETQSNLGNYIEYAAVHGITRQMEYALPLWGRFGVVRQRWGNWDTQLCVHGIIQCGKSSYPGSDNPQEQEEGLILISAYEDEDFATLCKILGREDLLKKFPTHDERVKAESQWEIYPEIEKWAADKTKEQVEETMLQSGITCQPAWNSKEVATHEHFLQRGEIIWLDDPCYGEMCHQGPTTMMSETPPRVKWEMKPVGADNEYIYQKVLGFSMRHLRELEERQVI